MTQADKFSEMLDARLAEYLRGLISNEEVIQELLKMARELKAHAEQASEFGLTEEEQAFYDAITRPQAVRDFYENETLVTMAKELTEALRNSKTIDWRQKESARANMRRMVKRLLKSTNTHLKRAGEGIGNSHQAVRALMLTATSLTRLFKVSYHMSSIILIIV